MKNVKMCTIAQGRINTMLNKFVNNLYHPIYCNCKNQNMCRKIIYMILKNDTKNKQKMIKKLLHCTWQKDTL